MRGGKGSAAPPPAQDQGCRVSPGGPRFAAWARRRGRLRCVGSGWRDAHACRRGIQHPARFMEVWCSAWP